MQRKCAPRCHFYQLNSGLMGFGPKISACGHYILLLSKPLRSPFFKKHSRRRGAGGASSREIEHPAPVRLPWTATLSSTSPLPLHSPAQPNRLPLHPEPDPVATPARTMHPTPGPFATPARRRSLPPSSTRLRASASARLTPLFSLSTLTSLRHRWLPLPMLYFNHPS